MTKQIITAETVRLAWKAGESVIVYAKGDIVTQQAQDDARHYGITLTTETPVAPSSALAEPEAEAVPPVPPVLEEVPASQEPVHVPTPALTADQLAAAARQLQEALVPLTQALTASVAPAAQPVPPVSGLACFSSKTEASYVFSLFLTENPAPGPARGRCKFGR